MYLLILEIFMVLSILTLYINNLFSWLNINNKYINILIEKNYWNIYKKYLYNMYEDSFDNNEFKKQLGINTIDCNSKDNDWNWTTNDPIDGCMINFYKDDNKLYKYQWHLCSNYIICKNFNKFIFNTFLTVKEFSDYYKFNIFTYKNWHIKLLDNFNIQKDK